jgi:NifU-like protein involved in Fe-S cluster formation
MSRKLTEEELSLLEESGYSEKAIELYVDKVNVGLIWNADVTQTYSGPCGDVVKLYLKVNNNGVIEDAKFYYLGCPGSAASASAMTRLVKGKTIEEAEKITEVDVLKELGGLPKSKLDCPKLAVTTLRRAIVGYKKRNYMEKI